MTLKLKFSCFERLSRKMLSLRFVGTKQQWRTFWDPEAASGSWRAQWMSGSERSPDSVTSTGCVALTAALISDPVWMILLFKCFHHNSMQEIFRLLKKLATAWSSLLNVIFWKHHGLLWKSRFFLLGGGALLYHHIIQANFSVVVIFDIRYYWVKWKLP